jgi:hypothetical protein
VTRDERDLALMCATVAALGGIAVLFSGDHAIALAYFVAVAIVVLPLRYQ